jgi:hypothetical protein
MAFTIDDLCQSSGDRRRTSQATPARSDLTGSGPVGATLFCPGLAACSGLAAGRDARAWGSHRHQRCAGDGPISGAPLPARSSGPEPRRLVGPAGESDCVGPVAHAPGASRSHERPRGRRHGGTALWTADPGEGV